MQSGCMVIEYIFRPVPGHSLREAIENRSFENTVIWPVENGILKGRPMHYTPELEERLRPKPPPEYYQPERIMGERELLRPVPEGHFMRGMKPAYQAIYMSVRERKLTEDQIFSALVKDFRIMPPTNPALRRTLEYIKQMHEAGFLIRRREEGVTTYSAGAVPKGGPEMIGYRPGFVPEVDEIVRLLERNPVVSRSTVYWYLCRHLEWATEEEVDELLEEMGEKGIIEWVDKNHIRLLKKPEPF